MMRKNRLKKGVVAFGALASCASVAWASCGGTEPLVVAEAAAAAAALASSIGAAGSSIVALDNVETEAVISSLKALTQQVNSSAEKSANVTAQSEQALASVAKDLADKELVDKVMLDYTSQGFDPCGQLSGTLSLAQAERAARSSVATRVRTEVQGGGGRYAPQGDILRQREDLHQQLFCTQAEVDAGICSSVGKIPGGDTNAALLFQTAATPEMQKARNAVINNIVGLPENPLPRAAVNTPEGNAFVLEKKKKDAFLGFAATSLKSIQADTETLSGPMSERIGQYFGTPRAMEWAKDQASQAQRGLLVDLVKIQGLQLKVMEQQIRQNLRTEANLAALLELENQSTQGHAVKRAETVALAQEAARKVTP